MHRPGLHVLDGSAIDSTPDDSRSKSLRRSTQFSSRLSRPHPSADPHTSLYWSNEFGDSPDWPGNRTLRVQSEELTRPSYRTRCSVFVSPFHTFTLWTGTWSLAFQPPSTSWVAQATIVQSLCNGQSLLASRSSVCYKSEHKAGGGGLVSILMFIIFITAIVFFLLGLGYGLSWIEEERSSTRRYRIPQQVHYRRNTRRRRCKGGSGVS